VQFDEPIQDNFLDDVGWKLCGLCVLPRWPKKK